jgi:hypothetical protein
MNPAVLEATDDLTNLSHLNEPAGTMHSNIAASAIDTILDNTDDVPQSCRRFGYDMRKKKSTHTPV